DHRHPLEQHAPPTMSIGIRAALIVAGIASVALFVTLLAGFIIRRRAVRRIREAAAAMSLAGAGDHAVRLPEGPDDIGALARAFNTMQEGLHASRSRSHAALEFQAMHDALTGLPNRTLLLDRLDQAIRAAQRGHHRLALMLADLDHFKEINDNLGHPSGDLILQQAAERMRGVVRDSD